MTRENPLRRHDQRTDNSRRLSVHDLEKELNIGVATLKFILKRFRRWLPPCQQQNGDTLYTAEILPCLIQIQEFIDQGLLPSQIESVISATAPSSFENRHDPEDIRINKNGQDFIQTLFNDIKGTQDRIALAHEKRAAAEERKALAIEKRAEAEEKKAQAMNNIAAALQEMNRQRAQDHDVLDIAAKAARAIDPVPPLAEKNGIEAPDMPTPGLDDTFLDDLDLDDISLDGIDVTPFEPGDDPLNSQRPPLENPDDLSLLIEDDPIELTQTVDDLGPYLDSDSDLEASLEIEALLNGDPLPEPDDLTHLLEPGDAAETQKSTPTIQLDDLYSLIDADAPPGPDTDLDDLSLLVDGPTPETGQTDLDDLSLLIDDPNPKTGPADLDDLSLLVDGPAPETGQTDLDDLSLLIDGPKPKTGPAEIDDLSRLIDTPLPPAASEALDDLSLLVDTPDAEPEGVDMDDLSLLVDSPEIFDRAEAMDDLSLLVEPAAPEKVQNDHLSLLIDTADETPAKMDDLSLLIDDTADTPVKTDKIPGEHPVSPPARPSSLKPDITPQEDLAGYKAAVMKIILQLKSQGLTPAETAERLNQDEVPTLSGNPLWRDAAISKIYGFIDAAR